MVSMAQKLDLHPDQLALYFSAERGIEASELGSFLRRLATIARHEGGELRVVGIENGSLSVIFDAISKSKVGQSAKKEFLKAPVDTSLKATALVGAIATAIAWAMNPEAAGASPLAKSGAEVIEKYNVNEISTITVDETRIVMDEKSAEIVRRVERRSRQERRYLIGTDIPELIEHARVGRLEGGITVVEGDLYFRPDGFRYLVPVDQNSEAIRHIFPGAHFRVTGEIRTHRGSPDMIRIESARRV